MPRVYLDVLPKMGTVPSRLRGIKAKKSPAESEAVEEQKISATQPGAA